MWTTPPRLEASIKIGPHLIEIYYHSKVACLHYSTPKDRKEHYTWSINRGRRIDPEVFSYRSESLEEAKEDSLKYLADYIGREIKRLNERIKGDKAILCEVNEFINPLKTNGKRKKQSLETNLKKKLRKK